MPRFITPQAATTFASLAAALALAACSDATAPRSVSPDSPSFTVGTTTNVGPVQVNLASSAATQYCGFNAALNTTFLDASCVAASDLQTVLATYNPGWSANMTGSSWIGSQANANQYTVLPGTYKFNTSFNIPLGATSPVLNLSTLSDNLVAVYLNDHLLGGQAVSDCVTAPCNWQQSFATSDGSSAMDFIIGGTNKVTIYLTDTPIGLGKGVDHLGNPTGAPLYNCAADGPQQFGEAGFPNPANFNVPTPQYSQYFGPGGVVLTTPTWLPSVCLNPAGLDYVGTVSYVPAPPQLLNDRGCSPGYWKNHAFVSPYTKDESFLSVFGIDAFHNESLETVISTGGGGLTALGRATVSALLNAQAFGTSHYGESAAQVILDFNAVFKLGVYQSALGDALDTKFEAMQDVNGRTCFP